MIELLAFYVLLSYEPNIPTQPIHAGSSAILEKKIPSEVIEIRRFFESYNSVLSNYAQDFYDVSQAEGLDYRILPSISMVESTGGKNTPSCARFNPFGWSSSTSPCGFYRFLGFKEAIKTVGEGIGRNRAYSKFRDSGEISELANVYNPGNKEKWEKDLRFFMGKI